MLDYQKGYTHRAAEREQKVYQQMLATYEQLLLATDEGVFEITVRSQSGTITVPIDLQQGSQLTADLIDCFVGRLKRLERNLNNSLIELGFETRKEREQQAQLGPNSAVTTNTEGRVAA